MLPRLAALALLLPLLVLSAGAAVGSGSAALPATHYTPHVGDSFTFAETIAVSGGYGNYSGYTERDALVGTLTVTAVLSNGTETATYNYTGTYTNSEGADRPWVEKGTFTFSATTYDYLVGTDNETGYNYSEVWFYVNNSLGAGASLAPLATPMTITSVDTSFPLDNSLGTNVATIMAEGTGTYVRDDSYGLFNATYAQRSYFDPGTGYIVAFNYTEEDANGHGDGFLYTDTLAVTKTSYALTAAAAPTTYTVTFLETGLASATSWTATLDGVAHSGTASYATFSGLPNGTYVFRTNATGYTVPHEVGFVSVSGSAAQVQVSFQATSSGSSVDEFALFLVVAIVVVVVIVVIAVLASRRSRRGPALPRHSAGGQVQYGPPPPPISLRPAGQPQIQQVVVKEVVKVNCRYCGSLIDSTDEKCPFCGATRT